MGLIQQTRFRLGSARHAYELHRRIKKLNQENTRLKTKIQKYRSQSKQPPLNLPNPEPEQDRIQTFKNLLSPLSGDALLDLGCGHGKFAVAAADLGWRVTGVDARSERWPDDKRIEWICSDVREYPVEDFDVISILGLLYHLDQPSQLELLKRCSTSGASLTILDTRVGLTQQAEEGGYRGEYYDEPGLTTSSWNNSVSFWPTEESLIKMARDAGFSLIAPVRPPLQEYRTFYVCYP